MDLTAIEATSTVKVLLKTEEVKKFDEYPTSLQDVYVLLVRQPKEMQANTRKNNSRGGSSNVMFAMIEKGKGNNTVLNKEEYVIGTDGKLTDHECYICHKFGLTFLGSVLKLETLGHQLKEARI